MSAHAFVLSAVSAGTLAQLHEAFAHVLDVLDELDTDTDSLFPLGELKASNTVEAIYILTESVVDRVLAEQRRRDGAE